MIEVLNKQIPLIETYDINNPQVRKFHLTQPTSGLSALYDSSLIDKNVWYCMFTTENSFKVVDIKELMGEDVFDAVINKTASIVLDIPFEPFLRAIDAVYEDIVIKLGVPSSQVIFSSNMYDAKEYSDSIAAKLSLPPIRIVYFSALEWMLNKYCGPIPNTLEIKQYDKKFLNLNRRWRTHRPLLVLLMYHQKLLDNGFVSFGPADEEYYNTWERIWGGLKCTTWQNRKVFNAVIESESIKDMPSLYLDTDELRTNRAELTDSTNRYYEDSYFSVVSETTFYSTDLTQNSRFVTEKTFKAIMMNHPFIIVSLPGSLEVLKDLGYKTFSPWINESYDQEKNDLERMLMIVDEIKRLSNLPADELEVFLIAAKEICSYNYNILKNKTKFIYEQ
jgi:hypothetical protein